MISRSGLRWLVGAQMALCLIGSLTNLSLFYPLLLVIGILLFATARDRMQDLERSERECARLRIEGLAALRNALAIADALRPTDAPEEADLRRVRNATVLIFVRRAYELQMSREELVDILALQRPAPRTLEIVLDVHEGARIEMECRGEPWFDDLVSYARQAA